MRFFQSVREDISCVFDRDPAARNRFEVLTCYSGVQALIFHRMNHRLWQLKFFWLARFLATFARWLTGIEIHPGAQIGRRFFIDHGMGIVIGETAIIGDDCTLYHGVTLGGTSWRKGKRHPTLENNIVIGAGAKILGPITLGDNVRVGSNAVVVRSIDAGQTAIGVPAKLLKEQQEQLKEMNEVVTKIGFDPYATGNANLVDPTTQAINLIVDHLQDLDKQVGQISEQLSIKVDDKTSIDGCRIEDK